MVDGHIKDNSGLTKHANPIYRYNITIEEAFMNKQFFGLKNIIAILVFVYIYNILPNTYTQNQKLMIVIVSYLLIRLSEEDFVKNLICEKTE